MKFFCLAILTLATLASHSATVDTVVIYSKAMHKPLKAVIIKPKSYESSNSRYPVVYLLHGYGGGYGNWIGRVPSLKEQADLYDLLIVCPDGHQSSWYFDSPVDSTMRYETYIGLEVPTYVDEHYKTINDPKGRVITGLSMGGHGALLIALRHPQLFGACGSMSGGVNLHTITNKFDVIKRLGDTITYADNWNKYSVNTMIEKYNKADSLAMIIDCGTEDNLFYTDNHALHERMLQLKIPHDYIERPGKHDWNYWSNAVKYQLLFFNNYFKRYRKL